jgi:catechol 2,3-dioxygenase-like lactoylglutathione lyase family enzyme
MSNVVLGMSHVGLTVDNLEEALQWFHDALGFEVLFREASIDVNDEHWSTALDVPIGSKMIGNALISNGAGCELEIFQYSCPDQAHTRPRNCDNGGHHLALQVSDLRAAIEQLKKAGTTALGGIKDNPQGPWEGLDWIYLRTPFGLYIELVQMPKDGIGYERATGRRLHRPLPNVAR